MEICRKTSKIGVGFPLEIGTVMSFLQSSSMVVRVASLSSFLHKINLIDSSSCYFCLNTMETPHHYLLVCPHYVLHRNKLFSRLSDLGLNQPSTTLSVLLSSSNFSLNKRRRIISALYTYSIDTGRIIEL